MKATFSRVMSVKIDGQELASMFYQLSADEMAEFFNSLGETERMAMQLQWVSDDTLLSSKGRSAMKLIGEYSEEKKEVVV